MWRVAVLVLATSACGRFDFDPFGGAAGDAHPGGDGSAGGDGAGMGDGGATDAAPGVVSRVGGFGSVPGGPGKTDTFMLTPMAAGDAIVFAVGCAGSSIPTAVSFTAPGWTLVALSTIQGTTTGPWAVTYGAIAPSTATATFTATWTVNNCQVGVAELADEFSGADSTGGTTTFDANNGSGGNGSCAATLTTASANEAIWAACFSGAITAVGAGYTQGEVFGSREWTEYAITTDPAGTVEAPTMPSTGQDLMVAVAIRPHP